MGRFSELNDNVTYIKNLLLQNQNLLKLIYYDNANPLGGATITNTNSLMFTRIFPQPKTISPAEGEKTILTYVFSNAKLHKAKFKNNKLILNIICHINLWKIDDGIRPYLITEEIDGIFNELTNSQLSVGNVSFNDWLYREYSNEFCGYMLIYNLCDFN